MENKSVITVKEWFFNKLQDEMRKYHWQLVGEYDSENKLDHTKIRVEEVLKETEKAVFVKVDTETMNQDCVANGYKVWIPKSVLA